MKPDPATIPRPGRQTRRARAAAGRKKHQHRFVADLKAYDEMDLENLAKTARLVLCDVGLYEAGSITWDYQGQTVKEAQVQMEAVLTMVAAEEKRRTGVHVTIRSAADCAPNETGGEDEDILRGSR
jgi:hypothetical protein